MLHRREEVLVECHRLVITLCGKPRLIHELMDSYPRSSIAAVVLARTQVDRIRDDLIRTTDPDDWVGQSTAQPITFARIAEMVSQYSHFFLAEAARYQIDVFDMDAGFDQQIAQALTFLQRSSAEAV